MLQLPLTGLGNIIPKKSPTHARHMLLRVIQGGNFPSHRHFPSSGSCKRLIVATKSRIMSTNSAQNVLNGVGKPRYIDIGINLTDPVYRGVYHGTQRHPDDLLDVLSRAREAGCQKLIITGSDLTESEKAVELAKQHPGYLYCTVGIHPCASQTFTKHPSGPAFVLSSLRALALAQTQPQTQTQTHTGTQTASPLVAFGEIGLDYDRLALSPQATQLEYFAAQLDVAAEVGLPLFLHSRAAHADFARLLRERLEGLPRRGVVHSFTGAVHEMEELVAMGFDIGVNGCSLKTAENVEVVRRVPWDRLQLETDGPWCEMRPSHASARFLDGLGEGPWKSVRKEKWVKDCMVKGRNEPCTISRVAVAVAKIRGVSVEEVAERAWENGVRMFGLGER